MPESDVKIIVNPAAGGGAVGRGWYRIRRRLAGSGTPADYEFTNGPGDARRIARRSAYEGYRTIVAVGGDGTVNEVANGILESGSTSTAIGVVSAGTAHAFALSMGISQDCSTTWSWLEDYQSVLIDVGSVECRRSGRPVQRFFVNEASLGLSAEMAESWERLPRYLGRSANLTIRAVSAYGCLMAHRNATIRLQTDGATLCTRSACIVVANGRYIADGMKLAPHAEPDDGLLDIVCFGDLVRAEILRMKSRLYAGSPFANPHVRETTAKTVVVESEERLAVEIDGDVIGESPASFRIVPSALRVAVPRNEDQSSIEMALRHKEILKS
jgi:diacylglycerol kinase (ATP)